MNPKNKKSKKTTNLKKISPRPVFQRNSKNKGNPILRKCLNNKKNNKGKDNKKSDSTKNK